MKTRQATRMESLQQVEEVNEGVPEEVKEVAQNDVKGDMNALPQNVPTLIELKKILPKHVFQSDVSRSMYYVLKDAIIIIGLYLLLLGLDVSPLRIPPLRSLYLPVYWFLQGTMMWAVFVLGHDCGHGSFSRHWLLNDIMGNFLHSFILVPYYPWKLSHRHHHKNTGNIDKDEIFYPVRDKEIGPNDKRGRFWPYFALGASWFGYLFRGYGYNPRNFSHLNPFNSMFIKHASACIVSLACVAGWLAAYAYYAYLFGFVTLVAHWLMPIFVFASWLVVVTFLHHQDVNVPWYADKHWDFVRGNLSSVDRDYSPFHSLTHNIGTHQIHHLFIMIPHYHLEEATEVFRQHYPHLVRICNDPIWPAFSKMFEIFCRQRFISDDKEIHVFKEEKLD